MQRAVAVPVEEAADLVLQLAHPLGGGRDEGPGQLLVGQPLAALDRVHEVALDRVAGRERHVVAALDHAGAAALAEQPLDRDGDAQIGGGLLGVERGEEPGAAGAEDQDVGLDAGRLHRVAPRLAMTLHVGEERAAVGIHADQQRAEIADREAPQALGVEVVHVDVHDRLDPGGLQGRRAADDGEVGPAPL